MYFTGLLHHLHFSHDILIGANVIKLSVISLDDRGKQLAVFFNRMFKLFVVAAICIFKQAAVYVLSHKSFSQKLRIYDMMPSALGKKFICSVHNSNQVGAVF